MVEQAFHKRPVVGSTPALDINLYLCSEEAWDASVRES